MKSSDLQLVYEHKDFIALNKPSGLLSVPGLVSPLNCVDLLKPRYPNIRVVHRLDMATSGLILFALNYETQKALSKLFEQRKIQKTYAAIVDGHVNELEGEINAPLNCDWENRPRQKINFESGKTALTKFRVDSYDRKKDQTRLSLFPYTGRSHQLRVHMWHFGHPILGDQLYFSNNSDKKSERLLLHAESLVFTHPISNEDLKIDCLGDF